MTREQRRLVEENLTTAKRAAFRAAFNTPRYVLDYEDRIALAQEYLCEAAIKWDGTGSFEGYAWLHIKRRIIDWLRMNGPITRMGHIRPEFNARPWVEDNSNDHGDFLDTPSETMMRESDLTGTFADGVVSRMWIEEALDLLDARERYAVERCVLGDFTLREVGDEWGVTEGRVSQILTKALNKLRRNDDIIRATIG